jgi:hypothetical protein
MSPPTKICRLHRRGGDEPSMEVNWSGMSGSPLSSLHRVVEVSSTRRSEPVARENGAGSSSQPVDAKIGRHLHI